MITNCGILRVGGLIRKPGLFVTRRCHNKPIQVAWRKPEIGWTKLNFDGSCKPESGKASIGGVFRNHDAEFLLGYAEPIGYRTSTLAELAALLRGLELVLENGWSDVWIEGDAKTLIESIVQRKKVRCPEIQRHLRDFKSIMKELNNCIVTHIYREGNRAADKFAQLGHSLKQPKVWKHTPPDEVLAFVNEDAKGKGIEIRR